MKTFKDRKTMLRFAIESIEFHTRGLFLGSGSYVRVKKLKTERKTDTAIADIEVYANGGKTKITSQRYNIAGLETWVNTLSGHGKA